MKFHLTAGYIILAAALSFAGYESVSAQEYANTPVSISKEKVKVNGTICYSHVVLERQTLFSICKAYNVSAEDIYRFNPAVREKGLIKNSIIVIPVAESSAQKVVTDNSTSQNVPAEATKVEVKAEGQETAASEKRPEPKKRKKTHTVKWFEDIDDIAAKYGVSPDEIMLANNLESRKLKSRMKLTIPEPGQFDEILAEMRKSKEVQQADTTAVMAEPAETEEPVVPSETDKKEKVIASVLLPLNATGTTGSRSNMDFYSGVLLAVNDLSDSGISIDLNVHDIARQDMVAVGKEIGGSDMTIGPVSVRNLNEVLSSESDTPMVISPLDPRAEKLVAENPKMIQAPTPYKVQYNDLMSWMKTELQPSDKVLLVTEKGARLTETASLMKATIDSSGVTYSTFSYSILEGRDVMTSLEGLMTLEGTNRVVIASESEAFVNDVVRNLNVMIHMKYPVVLYGTSKMRNFETIEVENFHNTNMHVSLTYYIDYDDPKVKTFLLKYRALFNTEPTQFAFQGYDIATYFIEMCSKYGTNWQEALSGNEKSMLQSTFKCVKDEKGGYVNHGVRRIVYGKDWTISRVR